MKFFSFTLLASASLATAAVIPFANARLTPVRASAAAIVEREPARATAAILAHATAAIAKRGYVPPPQDYIAKLKAEAKAAAAAKVHARGYVPYVPKVDGIDVGAVANAIAGVAARDVLHDDIIALAKVDAPVHGDAVVVARAPGKEPHKEFVPPIIAAAKVDAPVKAEGVVIARDVLDSLDLVNDLDGLGDIEGTPEVGDVEDSLT